MRHLPTRASYVLLYMNEKKEQKRAHKKKKNRKEERMKEKQTAIHMKIDIF